MNMKKYEYHFSEQFFNGDVLYSDILNKDWFNKAYKVIEYPTNKIIKSSYENIKNEKD